uniref:Uncharacterized protein n=1 Tax=Megaviridae environmental sample TaxID=1737588 RepID=A0A5J6VLN5_9VIRU|nr:MAG: hypothetical protein [Megaviridae environmental sample]
MIKYTLFGFIFGIIYIVLIFGNKPGEPHNIPFNLPPFIIDGSIFIKGYHIHHWLLCSIFLLSNYLLGKKNKYNTMLNSFLLVLIVQGLSYDDRFEFYL